jgi:hypothetical protein
LELRQVWTLLSLFYNHNVTKNKGIRDAVTMEVIITIQLTAIFVNANKVIRDAVTM